MNHLSACLKHLLQIIENVGVLLLCIYQETCSMFFFCTMLAYVEKNSEYCVCELIIY